MEYVLITKSDIIANIIARKLRNKAHEKFFKWDWMRVYYSSSQSSQRQVAIRFIPSTDIQISFFSSHSKVVCHVCHEDCIDIVPVDKFLEYDNLCKHVKFAFFDDMLTCCRHGSAEALKYQDHLITINDVDNISINKLSESQDEIKSNIIGGDQSMATITMAAPANNIGIIPRKYVNSDDVQFYLPQITKVIYNNPATIVFWADGTKTVVKCQEGDTYDKEKGFYMCVAKKALGNKSNFNNEFKRWLEE